MLSEKSIIKLSLAAIIIGLGGLYLATLFIEPEEVPLSEINEGLNGKVIQTQGTIKSVRVSNTSTAFISIAENGTEIPVVKFNSNLDEFQKGDIIRVTGDVSLYEGKVELLARAISSD